MQEKNDEVYDLGPYAALDMLLQGIGLLPLGQVTSRPPLHKAVDRCTEVLDAAVKKGLYVPDTRSEGN